MLTTGISPKKIVTTERGKDGSLIYIDNLGGRWVDAPPINASSTIDYSRNIDKNGYFINATTAS